MIDAARLPAAGRLPMLLGLLTAIMVNIAVLLLIDRLVARREAPAPDLAPPIPIRFVTQSELTETESEQNGAAEARTPDAAAASGSAPSPQRAPPATAAMKPRPAKPPVPVKSPPVRKPALTVKPRPTATQAAIEPPVTGSPIPVTSPPRGTSSAQDSAAAGQAPPSSRTQGHGAGQSQGTGSAAGGTGGSTRGGGGHSGVVVLSRVMPRYPPKAERQRLEGSVTLELTINAAGVVSLAAVVAAQPPGVFEEAALEAIRQWRFKPAYRSGRAVEQRARQRMYFRLPRR